MTPKQEEQHLGQGIVVPSQGTWAGWREGLTGTSSSSDLLQHTQAKPVYNNEYEMYHEA